MKTKNKIYMKVLANFTIAKFISALITITMLAAIKYSITGSFYIEYSNFPANVAVGLLGFTINTGFVGIFSDYLGLKGLNLNLKELMFGFEKLEIGGPSLPQGSDKLKVKISYAMDSQGEPSNTKSLDKGKGVYTEPAFTRGPLFSPRTNPGPGFNVPGGEVPIGDEICKHIDYNTHILRQFKNMDLETAIEQRNNNHLLIRNMINRIAYAQNALQGEPAIPTNEHQYNLRNLILKDLNDMNAIKIKAEGRIALLSSRIDFIVINMRKN